jgi:hypothetical protein
MASQSVRKHLVIRLFPSLLLLLAEVLLLAPVSLTRIVALGHGRKAPN